MGRRRVLLAAMSLDLGGAETHVISLAKALAARDYLVEVASSGGRLVGELTDVGIPHHTLPLRERNPILLWRAYRELGQLLARPFDLLHAHARIPAFVGDLARSATRTPLITTYHGVYNASLPFRLFTRFGDWTIAISDDVRDHLVSRFSAPADRISVIPNGIDTHRFRPLDRSEAARRLGIEGDGPIVAHVSRLQGSFADAAATLIEAVPLLLADWPQLSMIIAGDGDRLPELTAGAAAVNRASGRTVIHMLGHVADMPEVYAAADVVVGVARVALEAMACLRPVIIAGEGGLVGVLTPELMEQLQETNLTARQRGNELAVPALAAHLRQVLADPDLRTSLGDAGRQFILRRYAIDHVADAVAQVYERIING